MPVVRIQIDRDGDMVSNVHLGNVSDDEFSRISEEVMAICYRIQRE